MTAPDALAPIDAYIWNEDNEIHAGELELHFSRDRNIAALRAVKIIKL
jgi:hypothetical protein